MILTLIGEKHALVNRWSSWRAALAMAAIALPVGANEPPAEGDASPAPPTAAAQDSSPPSGDPPTPPTGGDSAVDLDRLLQLPESFDPGGDTKGGANAAEWRVRFEEGRGEIQAAQDALGVAKKELEVMAGDSGNYQVTAPGATNSENSPVSFKLRQEIRRQTEELERAQRSMRDLEVEANLAGVPENWRE